MGPYVQFVYVKPLPTDVYLVSYPGFLQGFQETLFKLLIQDLYSFELCFSLHIMQNVLNSGVHTINSVMKQSRIYVRVLGMIMQY